jgi:hypothetical protein
VRAKKTEVKIKTERYPFIAKKLRYTNNVVLLKINYIRVDVGWFGMKSQRGHPPFYLPISHLVGSAAGHCLQGNENKDPDIHVYDGTSDDWDALRVVDLASC